MLLEKAVMINARGRIQIKFRVFIIKEPIIKVDVIIEIENILFPKI